MKRYYRYGMAYEKEILLACAKHFDGLIVPAHLQAYYPSLEAFLTKLQRPWLCDPMTHALHEPESNITSESVKQGLQVKKSWKKYLAALTLPSKSVDEPISEDDLLRGERLTTGSFSIKGKFDDDSIRNFVESVLASQETWGTEDSAPKDRILDLLSEFEGLPALAQAPPEALVAPYWFFDDEGADLELNSRFVQAAKEMRPKSRVLAVVATTIEVLATANLDSIAKRFQAADGLLLWIDDSKDRGYDVKDWHIVSNAISALSFQSKREVTMMYASEAMTVLRQKGLTGFASGPGYSESKPRTRAAGGAVPARHYMPELFRSFTLPDTELYLTAINRIPCGCQTCVSLRATATPGKPGWIDRYCRPTYFPAANIPRGKGPLSPSGDNRKNEARHFIESTAQSRRQLEKEDNRTTAMRMRAAYDEILRGSNNPTAEYLAHPLLEIAQYLDPKDLR